MADLNQQTMITFQSAANDRSISICCCELLRK